MVATENNTSLQVQGLPVELRDANGRVMATSLTDNQGQYGFGSGIAQAGSNYYVSVVPARTQSATPQAITPLLPTGASVNLNLGGYPATIQVTGNPSDFVLVTTNQWPANTAAPGTGAAASFTNVIGTNNTATINVPNGSYWLTCWRLQPCGSKMVYLRMSDTNLGNLTPSQQVPSTNCGAVVGACP